jgi:hypothetical protein
MPAYAGLWSGVLFHVAILTSSTEAGGAVWARKAGENAKAEISASVEIGQIDWGIWGLLPRLSFDFMRQSPRGLELLAIDDDSPFEAPDRPPVLGGRHVNHDLIPRLEHDVAPAQVGLRDKILGFDDPM